MKIWRHAAAGILALAAVGAATAQDISIAEVVRALIEEGAEGLGGTRVGAIQTEEVWEDETTEFFFDIDPRKSYVVIGACDADCYDLDLYAHDAYENDLDYDDEGDAEPILIIGVGESGDELHVVVEMIECDTGSCYAGVGVYEYEG